mmetsp:Transcript_8734/g.16062  ORF Transcript_8734/g.16062 Transcript_8734/m.16062 type:complete len:86 (-) Transcript_8734:410-667(-)
MEILTPDKQVDKDVPLRHLNLSMALLKACQRNATLSIVRMKGICCHCWSIGRRAAHLKLSQYVEIHLHFTNRHMELQLLHGTKYY